LTIGANGFLHALGFEQASAGTPGLVNIYDPTIYDPTSQSRIGQVDLPPATFGLSLRALTADASGFMYAVNLMDTIYKLDQSGTIVDSLVLSGGPSAPSLSDIDIAPDGTIAVASRNGTIFQTDTSLAGFTQFSADASTLPRNDYVAFTDSITAIPEPTTVPAMVTFAVAGLFRRRR
tara:strand:+ start:3317 stop:3847 length:531 start_codon:yes stop_codon:yes gene_type:complete